MAKRDRDEIKRIFVSGIGSTVKADAVSELFSRCGRIESIRFLGRKYCMIKFDHPESVSRALQLHNTRQPLLKAPLLIVTTQDLQPNKRPKLSVGAYAVLDPPRFNNFLIPVLPSFMSS
mmetsp:Transcript_14049/g.14092  ORF Transcript_14049/g.14092 Transcript_14049/m.14092 type:complete len:119 (-) Transcript_14049:121-477(-)